METHVQHSIKYCMDMIVSFEMQNQQKEDGRLQFYQFMVLLYHEMYQRPEEYMMFPKPYEEYAKKLKEQETQKKKEKAHMNNSKESTLRNTFQQAIQFYVLFFYNIGLKSKGIDEQSGALIILKEEYIDVSNQMNRIHESKYNAERYEVLSKLGIQIYQNDDTVCIAHTTYKLAMEV